MRYLGMLPVAGGNAAELSATDAWLEPLPVIVTALESDYMLATGRPTELAKILEPLAMPPEETISSSADANGEVANSTAVQHRHHVADNAVPPLTMPPDKTL